MGKIVKLKNKKTGVRVYPVTATSAVVDANSGERLNDILQNKVEEAPVDGNQYVRINGTWGIAQVATSTKEKCIITLASNQGESDAASIYGATVKVTDVDSQEVYHDGVWDGTEIALEFAPGVNYKVEVGAVADYATPESKTLTALDFNVRNLVMTYNTELVSVTLSAQNGTSVVGQKVTINGVTSTWNGTAITKKIAYGTAYEVSVNGKAGYSTPNKQSYVASEVTRNISFVYNEVAPGVYIESTDGSLYTSEQWDGSKTVNAIVIKTESVARRINRSFESSTNYGFFGSSSDDYRIISDINSLPDFIKNGKQGSYSDASSFLSELLITYNGKELTDQWVGNYEYSIALDAVNYTFRDGKTKGFLPSIGELHLIQTNLDAIRTALQATGYLSPSGGLSNKVMYSSTPYIKISDVNVLSLYGEFLHGTSGSLRIYGCTDNNGYWIFGLYE